MLLSYNKRRLFAFTESGFLNILMKNECDDVYGVYGLAILKIVVENGPSDPRPSRAQT